MKQLIFVDNDRQDLAEKELDDVKNFLEWNWEIPEAEVEKIKTFGELHWMKTDDAYDILFEPKNVIITWSSYTWNHLNSAGKFIQYMAAAGRNSIHNRVYIDLSGNLKTYLFDMLDRLNTVDVLKDCLAGIAHNNILLLNDDGLISRLYVNMGYRHKEAITLKPISKTAFKKLLK